MSTNSLAGRTALVTGSSGGIGSAIAESLAQAGLNIVLHGLEPPSQVEPQRLALERGHGVEAIYLHVDLADPAAIAKLVENVNGRFGTVDILVNNAVTRHFSPIEQFPVDKWDHALSVNVSAAFHLIRLTLAGMRQRKWGRIVNISSVYGTRATVNRVDYVTTKTALLGLTRAVALETVLDGITCNALCPGAVHSPNVAMRIEAIMRERSVDLEEAKTIFLANRVPMDRFVDAKHIGEMVAFLCSPAADEITGAMLPLDGGWLAS